jgi:glycosyltransferase involved in cell wall biosynthesis
MLKISVVIPTYNDLENLKKNLACLESQTFQGVFEVVVVDDGSQDLTLDFLKNYQALNFTLKYYSQNNKKQGAARNLGVKKADCDVIIFIGSDILVSSDFLEEHFKFHQKFFQKNIMGLGPTPFSPDLADSRFRKFLVITGMMNRYFGLKDYQQTNYWHFYTGNISLKKDFFTKFWFNEQFDCYGFEDIMLGYEMIKAGGKLYFIKNALAYHNHPLKKSDLFPNRMIDIGKSAYKFAKIHPNSKVLPNKLKYLIFYLLSRDLCIKIFSKINLELAWYAEMKKFYLQGISLAKKQYEKRS